MRIKVALSIIFVFLVPSAYVMGLNRDSKCFISDKLRVQIGEHAFTFPREAISSFTTINPDVEHPDAPELCQKSTDSNLKLTSIYLYYPPKACGIGDGSDCLRKRIMIQIIPQSGLNFSSPVIDEYLGVNPLHESKEERLTRLTQECANKEYFGTCRHWIVEDGLVIRFHYYLETYPIEAIERTVQTILQFIHESKVSVNKKQ